MIKIAPHHCAGGADMKIASRDIGEIGPVRENSTRILLLGNYSQALDGKRDEVLVCGWHNQASAQSRRFIQTYISYACDGEVGHLGIL